MPILYQDRTGISLYDAQFASGSRGPISAEIMQAVVNRLLQFKTTCADFGVPDENIYVLATEATRTAPNSTEFRELIQERVGWGVRMLSKEDEGRIGALGVASSSTRIAGLVMDLGGGSTQITWLIEEEGVVTTSPRGSFSFPYGAAALKQRLEGGKKKKVMKELREEMDRNFQDAYAQLELPGKLLDAAKEKGGLDLYLCGGGFRGWGYLLMEQSSSAKPYPIPIINGYRASRKECHAMVSTAEDVADSEMKVFGVSKRRATQIPAVAVLVDVLMETLPGIKHVQFCQGGVREGILFDILPVEVRRQDPLLAATMPYAPPSAEAIWDLLWSALPTSPAPSTSSAVPGSFSGNLISALANLLFVHSSVSKETRAAAALHCTTTGILATANSLSHTDRALLALILCERWGADLASADQNLQIRLRQCVSSQEAWWCQYLGRVATLIGDVYPSGRVSQTGWRIRLATEWDSITKKKETGDLLRLKVQRNKNNDSQLAMMDSLKEGAESIEKAGKKKNWIQESGVRVGVDVS
ncbi:hypothetical protein ASPWEDRAFT_45956 [Aspergillus wentii DTO 134E9]|uniref:Uncharacterized protein n=1 Tax=Aspergillus wentii DTO 134E9 TaxID=1073089 RepID=A0A1L9R628_ASPWE|nr:uncharacterized protein ASPWEDRAFT_45956 [Aspergillus wentii DTO 134E9]KAI9926939.1 hypothetical protein MW887_004039 [Aspergillus wentii]OJJ30385.1 hypothetical protein ASPWEDRAFT_45956 [Aspergillus wentii DTO 134E9]